MHEDTWLGLVSYELACDVARFFIGLHFGVFDLVLIVVVIIVVVIFNIIIEYCCRAAIALHEGNKVTLLYACFYSVFD